MCLSRWHILQAEFYSGFRATLRVKICVNIITQKGNVMTREELLRILDFVDTSRSLSETRANLSLVDPRWNLISHAVRRHCEGKLNTSSSMAMAANVPYGTALRRINELLAEGLLLKRPSSKTGKSFSLHPSRELIQEFESYALQLKAHIGHTFGFSSEENGISDFYFGGSYMASRILSFPSVMKRGIGYEHVLRILSPSDPTFRTLSDFLKDLKEFCGGQLEVTNLPLDELHDEIMHNSTKTSSKYDVIAIDLPWIGEFVEQQVILPLTDMVERKQYRFADYHTTAWKGSSYNGEQYAIPVQPTAELLFYRTDLFSEAGLAPPMTTNDVIFAAKQLHQSRPGLNGIVMNYGAGTPIAHTFIQTMADFGQPIVDMPRVGKDFIVDHLSGLQLKPMINSDAGYRAAEYMLELLKYAHPDSINASWDQRVRLFAEGHAAMTYGWSIRAAVFELDASQPAHGHVGYLPHPHGPRATNVSPIGGFSLAIPTNLPQDRVPTAWKIMQYLTSPEMMKWYVQNGSMSSPRFSTSSDPEIKALSNIISRVDMMEKKGQIQLWPRAPIPEFASIVAILGEEIHDLVRGKVSITTALEQSQSRVDKSMRQQGRY